MSPLRLILLGLFPFALLAQVSTADLSAEFASGNPELKICYNDVGAVALYKTRNWLSYIDDGVKDFDEEEILKPFYYQDFKTFDEFLNGRTDSAGRQISNHHQNLYPCGPNRVMTIFENVDVGIPKNWDGRPMKLDPKKYVWTRFVKVFENTPSGIILLDDKATAKLLSEILDDPEDALLGWMDGRIYWCKKNDYRTVYWRKDDDRKDVHAIELKGRMYRILGILRMKSGAVGMIGSREPRLFENGGRRIHGLFELTKGDSPTRGASR